MNSPQLEHPNDLISPPLPEFRCTIHDFRFAHDRLPETWKPGVIVCPMCSMEDVTRWRDQAGDLRRQRDALLAAIEIKRTVISTIDGGAS